MKVHVTVRIKKGKKVQPSRSKATGSVIVELKECCNPIARKFTFQWLNLGMADGRLVVNKGRAFFAEVHEGKERCGDLSPERGELMGLICPVITDAATVVFGDMMGFIAFLANTMSGPEGIFGPDASRTFNLDDPERQRLIRLACK